MEVQQPENTNYNDDPTITSSYYYKYIWKNRASWTKHIIPVRVLSPTTGLYLEGFIDVPYIPNDLNKVIPVKLATLNNKSIIDVPIQLKDIYPTYRKLTWLDQANYVPITSPEIIAEYLPTKLNVEHLATIAKVVTTPLTHQEMESMLNNEIPLNVLFSYYKAHDYKLCNITGKEEMSYIFDHKEVVIEFPDISMEKQIVQSLAEISTTYKTCQLCHLGQDRVNRNIPEITLPRLGKVNIDKVVSIPNNTIAFIGEAPGTVEEEQNRTFSPTAPAGEVLYKVLKAAKFEYELCYFTNAVLCRPESDDITKTKNGKPTILSIDTCNTRLKNELAIINPKVIVLLGQTAYRSFFGEDVKSVLQSIGWIKPNVYLVPHPSYIVRELSYAGQHQINNLKTAYLAHFKTILEKFEQLKT